MTIIDINAAKKWAQVPKEVQRKLVNNVYCQTCSGTTIVDYSIRDNEYGVLLDGLCKQCGGKVVRLVEDL